MNIITTTTAAKRIQSWGGATPPAGYVLLPDTVDTTAFYQYNGFVELTVEGNAVTAIAPNLTAWDSWKESLPQPSEDGLAEEIRNQRDQLLNDTDWTQLGDSPLTTQSKASFASYRQSLRDITEQAGFPTAAEWPQLPEAEKSAAGTT